MLIKNVCDRYECDASNSLAVVITSLSEMIFGRGGFITKVFPGFIHFKLNYSRYLSGPNCFSVEFVVEILLYVGLINSGERLDAFTSVVTGCRVAAFYTA